MEKISFELENIEVTYLDQEILKINQLAIHQFDRIGIVGKNGVGKSTLLKLLAGVIQPTNGQIKRHVNAGYFEQLEAPSQAEADAMLLSKLAIPHRENSHSGGEQTRLKLAQLLTHYNEALLIDEPTAHLDQEGIAFLLDELRYYYGAIVLISHNRAVLDELVTTIWEIRDGEVQIYTGNYSEYVAQKDLEEQQHRQAHEQFIKEKARLENAVGEKMYKANRIAQAKGMSKKEAKSKPNRMFETKSKGTSEKSIHRAAKALEQRMNQLEQIDAPIEEKPLAFRQSKTLELHNKFPIMADRMTLCIGELLLLDEVSFQIPLGKKIAITGDNGSGKSTLFQYILSEGEGITISPKARIGYFRQMSYQFEHNETVLKFIQNRSDYDDGFLRSVLHAMMFVGTDLEKNVTDLSGGEAMRLQLCQLFLGQYNVLLLDEPTNFLDIYAIEALEKFIKAYEGTILFVSHDQTFIHHVADFKFQIKDRQLIRQ